MTSGAIIGAGIAGLATAIFARQLGVEVEIHEQSGSISCDDHLLWIAPNGLHLLERLGLFEAVRAAGVDQEVMAFATRQLAPLMSLTGESLRRSCGHPIVALRRRTLWQALAGKWRQMGGVIHHGSRLEAIDDTGTSVRLAFADGRPSVAAPWVIGADGMGSRVRRVIAPESRVEYQEIRTWLGTSTTRVAARHVGRTVEAWGDGTRFVLTSLDGETVHFSALERSSAYESNGAPIPGDTLARLARRFAAYHPDVAAVLAGAEPRSLVRCNFGVVVDLPRSCRGLIAVVGDAAHGMPPNMGQGASLGLEDALWIAHELAGRDDAAAAFRRYDAARRGRVAEMRRLANAMNRLFQPESRWAQGLRDRVAALVPDRMTARRMGQLYQPTVPPDLAAQGKRRDAC